MMITSNQLTPGTYILLDKKVYRVESSIKVAVAKGTPFIKTRLKDLISGEFIEKNFKQNQSLEEISLKERTLEFLYLNGKEYLFLDVGNLDQVEIPAPVVGEKVNFLKEGQQVKALFHDAVAYTLELPQFLELMILKADESDTSVHLANASKKAVLETGASVDVPLFVGAGDIIKVDTRNCQYIQRV